MEEASALKTWFQPGPRPARDAFNHRGFINQELTLNPKTLNLQTRKALNPSALKPKPLKLLSPKPPEPYIPKPPKKPLML